MTTRSGNSGAERELVDRILAGSEADWHLFIDRYSGLVYSVLRRYLFDDEEIRDVWVQVMERLLTTALRGFAGRSSLGSWLVLVARSTVFDHLRSVRGRREDPAGLAGLDDRCQLVFKRFYREGAGYEAVRHELAHSGALADGESLAAILVEIEEAISSRALRRILWDLQATSAGIVTGRMLEFMDATVREAREQASLATPELDLFEKQTRQTIAAIRELMAELPVQERRALELRFDDGWPAHRIAEELELSGQREVYTTINRATRRLRRLLGTTGASLGLILSFVIGPISPSTSAGNPNSSSVAACGGIQAANQPQRCRK